MNDSAHAIDDLLQRVKRLEQKIATDSHTISLTRTCIVHDWTRSASGMRCILCGTLGIRRIDLTRKRVRFASCLENIATNGK